MIIKPKARQAREFQVRELLGAVQGLLLSASKVDENGRAVIYTSAAQLGRLQAAYTAIQQIDHPTPVPNGAAERG
jgi:hypothetical protein